MCAVTEAYPHAKLGGTMVEARNVFNGQKTTMHLDMEYSDFCDAFHKWQYRNSIIQNCFPALTNGQREFLISGCVPGTYAKHVGEL